MLLLFSSFFLFFCFFFFFGGGGGGRWREVGGFACLLFLGRNGRVGVRGEHSHTQKRGATMKARAHSKINRLKKQVPNFKTN